eukprot:scaffold8090_cov267-Pinguiococcus_pyrenoidosus.AAC.3
MAAQARKRPIRIWEPGAPQLVKSVPYVRWSKIHWTSLGGMGSRGLLKGVRCYIRTKEVTASRKAGRAAERRWPANKRFDRLCIAASDLEVGSSPALEASCDAFLSPQSAFLATASSSTAWQGRNRMSRGPTQVGRRALQASRTARSGLLPDFGAVWCPESRCFIAKRDDRIGPAC